MTSRALQLKVTLKNIKPPIWRRVVVAEDTTLAALHEILQVVMGWQNYHLHAFTIQKQRFGPPDPDDWIPVVDERKHRIGALVFKGHRFEYEYDFGDGWEHSIVVEAVRDVMEGEALPSCIAGRRACPPEDCGGPWGYGDMLTALSDAKHEEHERTLEWVGGQFDADGFELDEVNDELARLARPAKRARRTKSKLH